MKHPLLLTTLLFALAAGRTLAEPGNTIQPATTGYSTTGQTATSQSTSGQSASSQSTSGKPDPGQTPAEKEIFAAMNEATALWNKGDLDAYMALYDHNATMMLSSGRVGLDSIRGMYVKYYFPGGHPKQELAYDTYQLTMLGKDYALLTGRFILKANDKYKERTGTFSLTMVHRKDGWKILHDHSG